MEMYCYTVNLPNRQRHFPVLSTAFPDYLTLLRTKAQVLLEHYFRILIPCKLLTLAQTVGETLTGNFRPFKR